MQRNYRVAVIALVVCAASAPALAVDWPQEVRTEGGTIVVYQPQPEKLAGNRLTGRAALSIELAQHPEPIFGAFWFSARLDTDRERGVATVRDVEITDVRWPDVTEEQAARFTQIISNTLPKTGFETSLATLTASLATAEREQRSLAELKNDPPKIVFATELAVLLLYDGEPRFQLIEHTRYERALNTPFAVIRDQKTQRVYLTSGTAWYVAENAKGPFSALKTPPNEVQLLIPPSDQKPAKTPSPPPQIVVATAPTELVATKGIPSWKSLPGGKLLYVDNTETPWLRDVTDQQMYLLLSGRWFRAKAQVGPWTFVRADQLPAAFKDIPPGSDLGGLRVSVAGTEEAEAAVLDARIPQTAAVVRSTARLDVQYDGAPKFEKIPGTSVSMAVNTGAQVLEINQRYYAVDNGVWFTSAHALGPWAVADSIPEQEIAKIPPSSPVYNVTYVTIYDATPEVVYVGYTPGYLWSYPYYGVPVYGTGYVYPPYYGAMYYPRPPTWGFHVSYNPWSGWGFGVSWSNGFLTVGASWGYGHGAHYRPGACCGGWYGGGYRGATVINTGDVRIGNTVNVGNRVTSGNRVSQPIASSRTSQRNLYNQPANQSRVADRTSQSRNYNQARVSNGRANDVFADRSGTVARRSGNDWQVRDGGSWKSSSGVSDRAPPTTTLRDHGSGSRTQAAPARDFSSASRPSTSGVSTPGNRGPASVDRADLNRAASARQSGMSQSRAPVARSGGGFGGGGRRR
ncbi:MAG TPA: hypothetical protein VJR89_11500 [Polyangiales bacterium]|nr:hypothetical protein [Polyangiales bacterium]